MNGGVGGEKGYVGSVEGRIFVGVVGVGRILQNDLLGEWKLFGDVVNELCEDVS